jgi:O-antigen/teichoic acid export membrane protein
VVRKSRRARCSNYRTERSQFITIRQRLAKVEVISNLKAESSNPASALPRPVLAGNFAWTLSGNVIYAACQWVVLMCFAKLGTVEMVGQYALGLAITAPVFQFCGLQLRAVQVTDARNRYSFSQFAGMRLLTTAVGLVVVVGLGFWGHYQGQTVWVIIFIGGTKAVESLSDLCQGLFQKNERMDLVARSLVTKGIASVIAVAVTLKTTHSAPLAAAALVIAWTLVWAGYDLRNALAQSANKPTALFPRISPEVFKKLFILTLPLGFVMMLSSLNSNLPRYFLAKYSGEGSVGIFSALMYCIVAGNLVMGALGQAASPRLAKLHCDGETRAFCGLLTKLVLFGVATGVVGLITVKVAGPQILTLFYRPEYALHVTAFFWLMAAGAVTNVSGMLGVAVTAMQGFKQQAWIHLACSAIGITASFLLIPSMGILGAAFAVLILSSAGLIGFTIQLGIMIGGRRITTPLVVATR